MKVTLIGLLCLFKLIVSAQSDSLKYRSAIGLEVFGNSPFVLDEFLLVNVNYHGLIPLKNRSRLTPLFKIGYTTGELGRTTRLHEVILESGMLLGQGVVRMDVCLGYTNLVGKQSIRVKVTGTFDEQFVDVNYYDFLVMRIGMFVVPRKAPNFFFRFGITPHIILPHNPIPDSSESLFPQVTPRFNPVWGGLTVGAIL